MTREELDFIGSMNMCDEISNEAYKKIVCHCREQEPCDTCEHSDKIDGSNCYECVKGIRDRYNPQPCEDAISRSDMLDAVGHGRQYISEELQKIIKALPSVNPLSKDYNTIYYTPQPKTGHWIDDTRLGYHVSICSNCNWRGHGDTCLIYKPKYCPNCGAKMIEPQERSGEEWPRL